VVAASWVRLLTVGVARRVICVFSALLCLSAAGGVLVSTASASYTQTIDSSNSLNAVSCVPGTTDCVVSDSKGNVLYSTNVSATSEATWKTWSGPSGESPSQAVDCPSSSLCLLADGKESTGGKLYYATSLGGSWSEASNPAYGIDAISCASSSFCVDGQNGGGFFRYSTSPASTKWELEEQGSASMNGVFCLSSSFCAIADSVGDVHIATSTSVIESSSWRSTDVDGSSALHGIACVSTTSCVAVDGAGNVLKLTVASKGEATVSKHDIDGTNSLTAVTCSGSSTCVTVDNAGNVFVSTNGGESWSKEYALSDKLTSVSCASSSLCLAADTTGKVTAFAPTSSTAPVNIVAPSVSDEAPWGNWLEGQKLVATSGTWTGTEPISYGYQWESCNSEGAACVNISGATEATFMPTSTNVGGTLRVVVTATNSGGSAKATSAATQIISAQSTPEAHVINGAGQTVQSYGNNYIGSAGGQIQQAEAYAHAHNDAEVTLDPGTFLIQHKGGVSAGKLGAYCYGIFAYGNVRLRGANGSPSTIEADAGPHACEGLGYSEKHTEEYLYPLLYMGANSENQEEVATKLHVENMVLDANNEAYAALMVGNVSGSEALVQYITTQESLLTGIWVANATGTSSAPALVRYNTIRNAGSDGIVANGAYITVEGNTVSNAGYRNYDSNAISGGENNIDIDSNVVENSLVGIGLEGNEYGDYTTVYNNEIRNDCMGIEIAGEHDDTIDDNRQYDNAGQNACATPGCSQGGTCEPGFELGLRLVNSYNNFAYGNSFNGNGYGKGIVLWGTGTGHATEWNYIGLTWKIYEEYPGPIVGNTISDFANAMTIEGPSEYNGGNALWGNNGSTSGPCVYVNGDQNMADNSPESCN
jgi:hypothetical protein